MNKRRALWLAGALVVLAGGAGLVPGSPVYLPSLLRLKGYHDGHSTRYWLAALNSSDAERRHKAIVALGAIGPEAAEAAPALGDILRQDSDPETRRQAALALSRMGPAARTAVSALAAALEDEDLWVRMHAATALHRLEEEARPAIPALIKAAEDETNQTNLGKFPRTIQEVVLLALGRASAGSTEGVPALIAALEDAPTAEVRVAAALALGEVGGEARAAVPILKPLLRDGNVAVRQAADEALRLVGDGRVVAPLPLRPSDIPLELPEDERQYLWELEHHGNVLVKYGFGPLSDALKKGDAAALSRLLADNFSGSDLGKPRRIQASTAHLQVERLEDAGQPPLPLDRNAFVARLLEFRKLFRDNPPQVKIALMTLSPVQRGKFDGLWEGMGQLRMAGEHVKGAPAEVVVNFRYRLSRPRKEALAQPGWLRSASLRQVLTARASHTLFAEVAQQRGIEVSKLHDNWKTTTLNAHPGGVYVCDFNRDGILDILVTDATGTTLYQGRANGTFEDVTSFVGLPRQAPLSNAVCWIDIDGDGWEDLILGGRAYRNEQGKRFADYSGRSNLRLPPFVGSLLVADYDGDGKLDLYATGAALPGKRSWLEGKGAEVRGNLLLRNKGKWQFEDVTRAASASGGRRSTFTAAWLDANNDGWPDLHVINEFGDGVLLINNGNGSFSPRRLASYPADFGSMGVAVGDVNNDGHIDIYCANMYSKAGTRVIGNLKPDAYPRDVMEKMRRFVAGSQLHLNRGQLKFDQVGTRLQVAAAGWAYGPCLADLDNDGFLDIYATAGFISRDRNEPDG